MKIIIEGNVGAGKTTFLTYFLKYLQIYNTKYKNIIEFPEKDKILTSDKNSLHVFDSGSTFFKNKSNVNALELAKQNTQWYSLIQHTFLFNLDYIQNDLIQNSNSQHINIYSRSIYSSTEIFSNVLYKLNYLSKSNLDFLQKEYNNILVKEKQISIDLLIIVVCENEELLLQRLKNRDGHIETEYILELQHAYKNIESIICSKTNVKNIVYINTNQDLDKIYKSIENLIHKFF